MSTDELTSQLWLMKRARLPFLVASSTFSLSTARESDGTESKRRTTRREGHKGTQGGEIHKACFMLILTHNMRRTAWPCDTDMGRKRTPPEIGAVDALGHVALLIEVCKPWPDLDTDVLDDVVLGVDGFLGVDALQEE